MSELLTRLHAAAHRQGLGFEQSAEAWRAYREYAVALAEGLPFAYRLVGVKPTYYAKNLGVVHIAVAEEVERGKLRRRPGDALCHPRSYFGGTLGRLNELRPTEEGALPAQPKEVRYNPAIPIETFDVIVTDECHRSIYNLWRGVLEYFDAYLVGLTATPGKQTFGFFNRNLVMEYGHDRAVADGVNVKSVSEMLGHSSIAITLTIYAHVMEDMQEHAARVMGDLLFR